MKNKHISILITFLGLLFAVASIALIGFFDRPLSDPEPEFFFDPAGDTLIGSYYPGTQPFGAILLEGFGSDQVTMTSLASELARNGWHVFTFDFSGHGRSPGILTFDNAQTDRLAYQTRSALDEFMRISALNADQIFIMGHSLGARVALQSASLDPKKISGLVLLGTQVNLSTNTQSEFFTGTTDAALSWVQDLGPSTPGAPILLISGAWDDILTPDNAVLLVDKLTGGEYVQHNSIIQSEPENGTDVELHILPFLVHNYEPFSPRVIAVVKEWMENRSGIVFDMSPIVTLRIWLWVLGFAGIMLMLIGGNNWLMSSLDQAVDGERSSITFTNIQLFLWAKLLLWIAALPLAVILGGIFFFIPLGKPVFNLIYVGLIGGYGILLAFIYWRGKMPGVSGKLWDPALRSVSSENEVVKQSKSWTRVLAVLGLTAGLLILTAAYARTGWFYVFPVNVRMVWLLIFAPFTALGFWIGLQESKFQPKPRGMQTTLTLIGLLPFFLYTVLMAAIGSLSGMIGGAQGLLILWLVIVFGNLIQTVGQRAWLTAICMAFLLYWLILPQGVLF